MAGDDGFLYQVGDCFSAQNIKCLTKLTAQLSLLTLAFFEAYPILSDLIFIGTLKNLYVLTLEKENVWLEMLAFSIKSVTVFLPGICCSGPENGKYVMLNWVA